VLLEPDGRKGEITTQRRPLKEGESMEWILLNGVCTLQAVKQPLTCFQRHRQRAPTLHCITSTLERSTSSFLVLIVSLTCGSTLTPSDGRNSSTAFSLSSGTIGAALAAATSAPVPGPGPSPFKSTLHAKHIPAIAVSYGVVSRPVPKRTIDLANEVAVEVVEKLWKTWGADGDDKVQVYTVNVPLVEAALEKDRRQVAWTTVWRNQYGRLFAPTEKWVNPLPNPLTFQT
jgi:tubulin--tyrosine ligase